MEKMLKNEEDITRVNKELQRQLQELKGKLSGIDQNHEGKIS